MKNLLKGLSLAGVISIFPLKVISCQSIISYYSYENSSLLLYQKLFSKILAIDNPNINPQDLKKYDLKNMNNYNFFPGVIDKNMPMHNKNKKNDKKESYNYFKQAHNLINIHGYSLNIGDVKNPYIYGILAQGDKISTFNYNTIYNKIQNNINSDDNYNKMLTFQNNVDLIARKLSLNTYQENSFDNSKNKYTNVEDLDDIYDFSTVALSTDISKNFYYLNFSHNNNVEYINQKTPPRPLYYYLQQENTLYNFANKNSYTQKIDIQSDNELTTNDFMSANDSYLLDENINYKGIIPNSLDLIKNPPTIVKYSKSDNNINSDENTENTLLFELKKDIVPSTNFKTSDTDNTNYADKEKQVIKDLNYLFNESAILKEEFKADNNFKINNNLDEKPEDYKVDTVKLSEPILMKEGNEKDGVEKPIDYITIKYPAVKKYKGF
ncbi:hypothetical protein [Spiroplasma endosymbiont of Aspidapion aeneum]|uniref:hypothetical protein n=1 Tax=Spiroplasma endosymbiont of Aspidapion aeneum TaxID=3066276 RepID=UPI00313CC3AC